MFSKWESVSRTEVSNSVFWRIAQGGVARFDFENKFLPTTIPN